MADPFTLAAVGMAATASGGLISAFGQNQAGEAKANQLTYQSGVYKINQRIQEQNADYARATGELQAQESGLKTQAVIGKTRTAQGASNLDVNSGSSADVQDSERAIGQQDQRIIRSNAARKAYGFETEAMSAGVSADLAEMGAKSSRTSGEISALGTLISTAGSVASKWYTGNSTFGTGNTAYNPATGQG